MLTALVPLLNRATVQQGGVLFFAVTELNPLESRAMEQKIIRFKTAEPIEFDGMDGGPWRPVVGKDYVGRVELKRDGLRIIHFENTDTPGGWETSEPISHERFEIVGTYRTVVMTTMESGREISVSPRLKKFLEAEIVSYENMDSDSKNWIDCTLNVAHGNLKQMEYNIFADIMDLNEDEHESPDDYYEEVYNEVETELEDAISQYGGHSDLHDLFVWNR